MNIPGQNQARGLLSQSLRTRESGDRDFQAMLSMDQFQRQDMEEKQYAAAQEQQFYNLINEKADQLLGHDKKAVQEKVFQLQGNIRDKIKMYGGDASKFFANGGQRLMQGYTSAITSSDEFIRFQKNKENYIKIEEARANNLGHLVSLKDQDSLRKYEANKGGEISWSGLMSELEMPNEQNYDLNKSVPMDHILHHKDNFMKVLANYQMNHPNQDMTKVTQNDLLGFMKEMGYGVRGANRDKINAEIRAKLAAQKAALDAKEDKRPILQSTEVARVQRDLPKNLTVDDLYNTADGTYTPTNILNAMKADPRYANMAIFSSDRKWDLKARNNNLNEAGLLPDFRNDPFGVTGWMFKDKLEIANAMRVYDGQEKPVIEAVSGIKLDDQGYAELEPQTDWFRMDGAQLTGSRELEAGKYKGKYQSKGIVTAFKARNEDGDWQIMVSAHDDNGDIDTEATQRFADEFTGADILPTTLIAFQSADNEDDVFYKEVDIVSPHKVSAIGEALGKSGDLTDEARAYERQNDEVSEQEESRRNNLAYNVDSTLNASTSFQNEAMRYVPGQGAEGINRTHMLKSYYAAMADLYNNGSADSYVNGNAFTSKAQETGMEEFLNSLLNFSSTEKDDTLIQKFYNGQMQNLTEQEDIDDLNQFMRTWKYYNRKYQ